MGNCQEDESAGDKRAREGLTGAELLVGGVHSVQ